MLISFHVAQVLQNVKVVYIMLSPLLCSFTLK